MKKLLLLLLIAPIIGLSQTTESAYEELIKKSPFNEMYPKIIAEDAAEYFDECNLLFSEDSPIASKEARLVAVAVSAAIRCEYCISAQVHSAKMAGATDDEIKAAIQIAAEIQRFSTLLYGNDFGIERLEKILGVMD